ncbi:hypothetical protein Acid345_1184 [Candidatus Koribacter versatilis Ellin345]|uniref:Uncharacterized protein n=1 Tax=Koribacter versatilis (strain Ellin345) TaxID=204669 RepID=Q1ISG3_KORVE|nr:hypothetical protein [Candidatus Koribacter versatilis]ABF40187.1 hypothetical protein Acid345_1184 [Candidatus Koribacter versatilis Ellin345]
MFRNIRSRRPPSGKPVYAAIITTTTTITTIITTTGGNIIITITAHTPRTISRMNRAASSPTNSLTAWKFGFRPIASSGGNF